MKQKNDLSRILWPGIILLLLAGLLITLSETVTASDEIIITPTSGLTTAEAGVSAAFTVVLFSQPTDNVTIGLSSSDTSEGTVSPESLTFTPVDWSVAQTVTITGVDDLVDDGDITYTIITAPAVSTDPVYNQNVAGTVSVTNQDDDTAAITLSQTSGLTTTEANVTATFTVVLTSQPTADVIIGLSSSNTGEGTVAPPSLTFTTGTWSEPQAVTVTGVDDFIDDGDIAYTIVTTASSADSIYNALDPADVSVTNTDNDTAGFTLSQTTGLVTSEALGTASFTVVLTSQPTANVIIGLTSSNTGEGTVAPPSLTFTSGNWLEPQTVTVTGVDDLVADGPVPYQIITTITNGDSTYIGLNPPDVSVTNQDNDTAGITVSQTSGLVTTEALGTASFTVRLNSQPTANVIIGLTSSNLNEGTVVPSSLTFTSDTWSATQMVTVTGVDDPVDDGDIAYTIVTTASSTDLTYNAINPPDVSVTNQDNDTAGITVSPTSGLITTEAGGPATFTVVLTSQPTASVTIGLSSSNTGEGTVLPLSLTFTQVNWNNPQTVTVTGVDDFFDDGDILYAIVTAAAVSGDTKYGVLDPPNVTVTNVDNDTAGFTVTPTTGLTTTEAGGQATFKVRLTSQPTANVTIGLSSSNLNEGTVSTASLIFTPGIWSVDQTVTVTGIDDFVDDGDIAYIIVTAAAASGDIKYSGLTLPDVSVTNQDDDTAGFVVNPTSGLNTSEAGSEVTFTIVLTSRPLANVTIWLTSSDTSEGTVSPSSLTFIPTGWSIPQTVTVTGVDDLVADGPVAYQIVTAVTNGDTTYMGLNPPDVSLVNQDNDTAGITVNPTSGLITTEAGGKATFTLVLNTQPTANVTIGLSSSDTSEASVSPTSLTFTSTNWAAVQTVTATGVDDPDDDGDKPFAIITGNASSSDSSYSGMIVPDVSGINVNNDFIPVAVDDSYLTNATHLSPLKVNAPGVLANDTDANQDTLSARIVSGPTLGTLKLNSDGSFVFTPDDIPNKIWTDSFTYLADDGFLNSAQATVNIVIDQDPPIVKWKLPTPDGGIYEPTDRFLWLVADVIENNSIRQVKFIRWDAVGKRYVDIGVVYSSPFQWYLDTQTLNYQWNQVFVTVTDGAGNVSTLPFIWIFRDLPMQMFLPVISR